LVAPWFTIRDGADADKFEGSTRGKGIGFGAVRPTGLENPPLLAGASLKLTGEALGLLVMMWKRGLVLEEGPLPELPDKVGRYGLRATTSSDVETLFKSLLLLLAIALWVAEGGTCEGEDPLGAERSNSSPKSFSSASIRSRTSALIYMAMVK